MLQAASSQCKQLQRLLQDSKAPVWQRWVISTYCNLARKKYASIGLLDNKLGITYNYYASCHVVACLDDQISALICLAPGRSTACNNNEQLAKSCMPQVAATALQIALSCLSLVDADMLLAWRQLITIALLPELNANMKMVFIMGQTGVSCLCVLITDATESPACIHPTLQYSN